jgi:GH15 family glucan-1,4-alpha-glucosidase
MFSPISDYGVIGNLRTAALVNRNGSIDWLCGPNFDSQPLWFSLLDSSRGGCFRVVADNLRSLDRAYLEATAVLKSRFAADGGTFSATDFMPVIAHGFAGEHVGILQICRSFECESGNVALELQIQPAFAFQQKQAPSKPDLKGDVASYRDGDRELTIQAEGGELSFEEGKLKIARKLSSGERFNVLVSVSEPVGLTRFGLHDTRHLQSETVQFWRHWADKIKYTGPYREQVIRSAITLKLLQFSPTGAIVAAPTTSLPERIGDKFNWDYRFTWLRDAAFTAVSLLSLELSEEAFDFLKFVHASVAPSGELHTLYTVFGKAPDREQEVPGLSGYRDSSPVRVGNAAAGQLQLDIFGELMQCIYLLVSHSKLKSSRLQFDRDLWPTAHKALDAVCANWQTPDKGIWETRDPAQRFVYSQGMCLVALQRGIELAKQHGKEIPERWNQVLSDSTDEFNECAYNASLRSYVQSYGSTQLDASVLRLPLLGVVSPSQDKLSHTITAIQHGLTQDGFVLRNKDLDGAKSGEGAFLPCSFWLVDNLALSGKTSEAEKLFERLLGCANDLGLYSEEYDPHHKMMLGNFPQAFTHVALINSAVQLAIAGQKHKSEAHHIVQRTSNLREQDAA